MELRGKPISGDILTLDLLSGYHRLKPQVNSLGTYLIVTLLNKKQESLLIHPRLVLNADEESAKEEARQSKQQREIGYSNADVVVKLQGWDPTHAKSVAQASLSALKQLIISDKGLPGNQIEETYL